jgi:hypothetical protein
MKIYSSYTVLKQNFDENISVSFGRSIISYIKEKLSFKLFFVFYARFKTLILEVILKANAIHLPICEFS